MDIDAILGWVMVGSLVLGNLSAAWRGAKKKAVSTHWFALIAVGSLIFEAFRFGIPWWQAIVLMGMLYTISGPRMYAIFSQKYRGTRFLYYICNDLPPAIFYFFFILPRFYTFWSLVWWLVSAFIWILIFSSIAMALFPIVHRQELRNSLAASRNTQKASELDVEIRKLEYQLLRKTTLKRLTKQSTLVAQAERALAHANLIQANALLSAVISELEAVRKDLVEKQKILLGRAYLLRAKALCRMGNFSAIDSDLNKAYQFISVDEASLAELVEVLIAKSTFGASLYKHCVRYLTLRKGQKPNALQTRVWKSLQTWLAVKPGKTTRNYKDIVDHASEIIKIDPGLWWAHSSLGQASYLMEDNKQALASLEAAVQLHDKDASTWMYLGKVYQKLHKLKDAQRAYESTLSIDADQPDIAHDLGIILLDLPGAASDGERSPAFYWLQQAAKQTPANAVYQYDFARAAQIIGKLKLAKETVLHALELDASLFPAHLLAGNLFYDEENWKKALFHFESLKGSGLTSESTQIRLGHCYTENGRWDDAISTLEPLRSQTKAVNYPLGRAYLGKLNIEEAIDTLRAAIADNGSNMPAWYALGCALAWQSKNTPDLIHEARHCFERVVGSQHPLTPRAQLQLGHVAMQLHNVDEALKFYLLAYQSSQIKKEAGLALAKAYLACDRIQDASKILAGLESATRKDPHARLVYGLAAELRKDFTEAIAEYKLAGAHGPLGVVLFLSRKPDEAEKELALARAEGDQSDRVLYYSGLLHCQQSKYYEGIKEWETLRARHLDDGRLELNIARAWYLAGCEEYGKKDYVKAAAAWECFYKIYASDEETLRKLQYLYLRIAFDQIGGPEAAKALERARQLKASAELIQYADGLSALKKKDWKSAYEAFKSLVSSFPTNSVYQYNLGLASLLCESDKEAEACFKKALKGGPESLHAQVTLGLAVLSARQGNWARVATLTGVTD